MVSLVVHGGIFHFIVFPDVYLRNLLSLGSQNMATMPVFLSVYEG